MQTLIAAKLTAAVSRSIYTPHVEDGRLIQFSYATPAERGERSDGYLVTVTTDDGTEVPYAYVARWDSSWYLQMVRADCTLDATDTLSSDSLKAQDVKPHALGMTLRFKAPTRKLCLALAGLAA